MKQRSTSEIIRIANRCAIRGVLCGTLGLIAGAILVARFPSPPSLESGIAAIPICFWGIFESIRAHRIAARLDATDESAALRRRIAVAATLCACCAAGLAIALLSLLSGLAGLA